jgi:hypothetical protein
MVTRRNFDAIAAVFRLSLSYQIPALPRKGLTLLSSVYPTTLAELTSAGFNPSYCRDQILPVIQFARKHSIDWILPLAFYRYCLEMTGRTFVYSVEYGGTQVALNLADQERCFDALNTMRAANTAALLERYVTRASDAGCTGGAAFRKSRLGEGAVLLPRLGSMPDLLFR